jgi:hypothetical protein
MSCVDRRTVLVGTVATLFVSKLSAIDAFGEEPTATITRNLYDTLQRAELDRWNAIVAEA